MAILQELTDLALNLARLAAARSARELAQDEEEATAALPPPHRERKTPDPGYLFTRLSCVARLNIALEERITAPPRPSRSKPERLKPPEPDPRVLADKRRDPAREALVMLTKKHPEKTKILRAAHERLDIELLADPEIAIAELLQKFCPDLGITVDLGRLPDHVLGIDPSTWPAPPPAEPLCWPPKNPPMARPP